MDQDGKIDPILFSTCRLCVAKPGSYQIKPITQTQIKELFDISVDAFDGLPQLLCDDCRGVIGKLYTIRSNYQLKQQKLIDQQKHYRLNEEESGEAFNSADDHEGKQFDFSKMPAVTLQDITRANSTIDKTKNAETTFAIPTQAPVLVEVYRTVTPPPVVESTILQPIPNVVQKDNRMTECDDVVTSSNPIFEDESNDIDHSYSTSEEVVQEKPVDDHKDKVVIGDDISKPVVVTSLSNVIHNVVTRKLRISSTESNTSITQNLESDSSSAHRSRSKKGIIRWKTEYKCKFCNQSFPRLSQIASHMSSHDNLIKLSTELNLQHSYIRMERLRPLRVKSGPKPKIPDMWVTFRCNHKVQNVFDYYYLSSKLSNNGELSCDIIETEQQTRKLRLRRSYYVGSDDDSDSLSPPPSKKRSRIKRISSSSSENDFNNGAVKESPLIKQNIAEGTNAGDKSFSYLSVPIKNESADHSNVILDKALNENIVPETTSDLPPKPSTSSVTKDLIREHKIIIMSKVKATFDKLNYRPKAQRKQIIGKLLKNNETLLKQLVKYPIDIEWQHSMKNQKFEVIVTKNSQKVKNGFEDFEPVDKTDTVFTDVSPALCDCRQYSRSKHNLNENQSPIPSTAPKDCTSADISEPLAKSPLISPADNLRTFGVVPAENSSLPKSTALKENSTYLTEGPPMFQSGNGKVVAVMVVPPTLQNSSLKKHLIDATTVPQIQAPTLINLSLDSHDYAAKESLSNYSLQNYQPQNMKKNSLNNAKLQTNIKHQKKTRKMDEKNSSEGIINTQMISDVRSLQSVQSTPYILAPDNDPSNLVVYVSDEEENATPMTVQMSEIDHRIIEAFQTDGGIDNMPIISYTESWAATAAGLSDSQIVNNTPGVIMQSNSKTAAQTKASSPLNANQQKSNPLVNQVVGQVPSNQKHLDMGPFTGFEDGTAATSSNGHIASYIPVTTDTNYGQVLTGPQQVSQESKIDSPTTSAYARLPKLLPRQKLRNSSILATSLASDKQPKTYSRKLSLKEASLLPQTFPSTPNAINHNLGETSAPRLKCKPTSLLLSANNGSIPVQAPVTAVVSSAAPIDTYISRLQASGFSLVEDINSSNFTALARYNVALAKSEQKLMVSLFVCQEDSKRFCIQVTDNRGRLALAKEPYSHQMQIFQSLQMQDVTSIIQTNAKALSPSVLQNTIEFIATFKGLLTRTR